MTNILSKNNLIENAIKTSGLNDFGGDSFKDGLGAFIHSLNHDLQLNEMSAQIFKGMITQLIHSAQDPRILSCHQTMEGFFAVMPQLRGINGINFMANGTAECENLMFHEFIKFGVAAGSSLISYGNWVADCNMQQAYRTHKKLLQVLQWKMPNERWVLKAPIHLFGLDHLLETYPDARIVFTHRDPLQAIRSGVSMVYHWTNLSTQQADKTVIADWWPKVWEKGLKKALTIRNHVDASSFCDIYHDKITQDPVEAVRAIYNHFDLPLGSGHLKRMMVWLRDNPRTKFGNHDPAHETFNLNPDDLNERFYGYRQQFNV
jgi:hypothetical protein